MPRLAPYAAAVALLALAPGALAAPRSCRLVVDPKGDDRVTTDHTTTPYTDGVYESSDLDLRSADVATDAKNLTVVIRPETLRVEDPQAPTGRLWELWFLAGEERFALAARVTPDGQDAAVYHELADYEEGGNGATAGEGIGTPRLTVDHARREIRMTAPLSMFKPYGEIVRGKPLRELFAVSYHYYGSAGTRQDLPNGWVADVGGGGAAHSTDLARSEKWYVAGAPSCVAVGR